MTSSETGRDGLEDDTERLRLDLGARSYDIVVGPGLLARAGDLVAQAVPARRSFVVTDESVADLYLGPLEKALRAADIECIHVVVPAGERAKDFAHLEQVVRRLLSERIERREPVIALGGGVVGDLAGFAAAVSLRGVPFVQVPTTLLAQVDSSVGGKTGINTPAGKNLVGAFYQPRLVLADTETLDTLPRRELLAGYAEVVKYGLLGDAGFFEWLEANGRALLGGDQALRRQAVLTSCRAKADIVAADERESGQRALLNLGHTFGHALEAECGYEGRLLHGEAVAIGMVMAFELSAELGLCPAEDAARAARHLSAAGLPTRPSEVTGAAFRAERLLEHMSRDKKVREGRITFVLARGIGRAFLSDEVPPEQVRDFLERALAAGRERGADGLAGEATVARS